MNLHRRTALLASSAVLLSAGLCIAGFAHSAFAQDAAAERRKRQQSFGESSALVEIFLTESSLLSRKPSENAFRIERSSRVTGDRAFVLVYHVDYLNNRGWRDPFSKPEFTKRQQEYSRAFKHPRSEPQMAVINGVHYAPADRFKHVTHYIKEELRKPPRVGIDLAKSLSADKRVITLKYTINGAARIRKAFVYFRAALVEDDVLSPVTAGPNEDYAFRHTNIVRVLEVDRFKKGAEGKLELVLPAIIDPDRMSVIYFAQEPRSNKVLQVGRFPLSDFPELTAGAIPPALAGEEALP